MLVKDIIAQLQSLPQDAELVLYNGLVNDVQQISDTLLVEELKRHSLKYYKDGLLMDFYRNKDYSIKPSIEKESEMNKKALEMYNSNKNKYVLPYDDIDGFPTTDLFDNHIKKRVVLQAKLSGKTYHDRAGSIHY